MQINMKQSKDEILQDSSIKDQSNENSHNKINIICKKLQKICTLTSQIAYPKIQVKKIKKNSMESKKKKDSQSKTSKLNKNKNQCFRQTCLDLKLLEYLSQLNAIENLQHQLEKVKELIQLFD
ncbi:unnamed protein product [Paramecium sonneborni]|uniref:Uncharacterized protein n=1 Tax=Paramecium sonneborni TaxID=65129 RepID=A0A8S1NCD5_9CILI|nr:unnamed protein product [Paramecium sonneborni]